ncbi:MAG: creatininase family protein [Candidatus Hydrogenedentes bacterium]|nr:creatininase family protein [Candidatus Hydrogenedentota bacterium]
MSTTEDSSRRDFLETGLVAASTGILASGATQTAAAESHQQSDSPPEKVRYAELLPHEFRARLAQRPLAYLPLGTLEWHGEHLPLGSDAIQSEALMIECARRFGGIVMPPIHLGPDRAKPADGGAMLIGMDYAETTKPPRQLDGSCYWTPQGLHLQIVDAILVQLKRAGFQAVFADGHGPSRWSWVEYISERESRFGMRLLGVTKDIATRWKSQIDHAAGNETSLMLHYRPDLVDLSRLPASRDETPQGVGGGIDPRDATAEHGKECADASVSIVGELLTQAGLI